MELFFTIKLIIRGAGTINLRTRNWRKKIKMRIVFAPFDNGRFIPIETNENILFFRASGLRQDTGH